MNEAQRKAIRQAIGNVEDDLYRFRSQQRAMPEWQSGNDEPIADIVARLEAQLAQLKEPAE